MEPYCIHLTHACNRTAYHMTHVQLTAVGAMRALVDDWNFIDEHLVPFVRPLVERLMNLAIETDELETQTHVGG